MRCLIDEAGNIGKINQLERLVSVVRSREISICPIYQAYSQCKSTYKDNAETIIASMDSTLFLGGREPSTIKDLNEALGRETVDLFNETENRGREITHGLNYSKVGKELMSKDEIAVMDGGKCILQVRGVRPFFSDKYDITKHTNYKYLSDYDKKNTFSIEKFLSTRLRVKPDTVFDLYDMGP